MINRLQSFPFSRNSYVHRLSSDDTLEAEEEGYIPRSCFEQVCNPDDVYIIRYDV
jgi:hypothetical protein